MCIVLLIVFLADLMSYALSQTDYYCLLANTMTQKIELCKGLYIALDFQNINMVFLIIQNTIVNRTVSVVKFINRTTLLNSTFNLNVFITFIPLLSKNLNFSVLITC